VTEVEAPPVKLLDEAGRNGTSTVTGSSGRRQPIASRTAKASR